MRKKELERELSRWKNKANAGEREILSLRGEINRLRAGERELNKSVDAIMLEVTKKFGSEAGAGTVELTIPQPDIQNLSEYIIRTTGNVEDRTYTVRVERAVKDE